MEYLLDGEVKQFKSYYYSVALRGDTTTKKNEKTEENEENYKKKGKC